MRFLVVARISRPGQDPDDGKEIRVQEVILRRAEGDGDVIRESERGGRDDIVKL